MNEQELTIKIKNPKRVEQGKRLAEYNRLKYSLKAEKESDEEEWENEEEERWERRAIAKKWDVDYGYVAGILGDGAAIFSVLINFKKSETKPEIIYREVVRGAVSARSQMEIFF